MTQLLEALPCPREQADYWSDLAAVWAEHAAGHGDAFAAAVLTEAATNPGTLAELLAWLPSCPGSECDELPLRERCRWCRRETAENTAAVMVNPRARGAFVEALRRAMGGA